MKKVTKADVRAEIARLSVGVTITVVPARRRRARKEATGRERRVFQAV